MTTVRATIRLHDMMTQQLHAINMAMTSTIDYMQDVSAATGEMFDDSSMRAAYRELQRIDAEYEQMADSIRQAENQQEHLNRDIQRGENAARGLLKTLGAVAGTYLTLQSVGEVISLSDEMTNTTARLDLMNDGLQTTAELQQMIFESAQRSYGAYGQTADLVGKIGMNAQDAFNSNAEVVAFAELLNKQFSIAGTNAEGISAATLQLTQALGSGVLRGEELNSVFEQAPNIIHTIADYLDVGIGKIREMASDGELTAEVVKAAMFAAADDINEKFNSMPLTWSQVWQDFKNDALWAFGDVLHEINNIANSETFHAFANDVKSSLYMIAEVSLMALQTMASIGGFLYENWSMIGPLVFGAGGALLAYLVIVRSLQLATLAMTTVQWAWNAAMMANPIGLVIAAVLLLIGVFYAAIGALNHFAGTSISATGIIAGTFMVLDAFLHNTIAGWWNIFASLVEFWANVWTEPTYSIKRLFANLANMALDMATAMIGSFDSAATNLGNLFISGANIAISAINWVIDALNQIDGVSLDKMGEMSYRQSITADYSGLKSKINDWVGDAPADYWEAPKMEFKDVSAAWSTGYDWGANLFNGFDLQAAEHESYDMQALLDSLSGIENSIGDGTDAGKDAAGSAKKLADSVDMAADDLKYLRDITERDSVNRYTTASIKVDMRNENHINNELDIDGIIDRFGEKVEETVSVLAEGATTDV